MMRIPLILAGVLAAACMASAVSATPKLGDDCKACHANNNYLPPAHPDITTMASAVCKTCHLATMTEEQARDQTQQQDRDREQAQDQDRDQQRDQDRRQVRLGGDPGASVLGTHAAARVAYPAQEIERYLEKEREGAHREATGSGGDNETSEDHDYSYEHNHSETRMAEDANRWTYRLVLGLLYSSDIDQHQSASQMGGGGGQGGDNGHGAGSGQGEGNGSGDGDQDWGDHDGDGAGGGGRGSVQSVEGGFFRLGGRAQYSRYLGNNQTLTYSLALNRDEFFGIDQTRHVLRAGLDWKGKTDDGSWKVMPYLQRSTYDIDDAPDKAFWALGLNANRNFSVSPTSTLSLTFRYKQRHYDGEDAPRSADFRLGAVWQDKIFEAGRYRLGLGMTSRNNPRTDAYRYNDQVLTAGLGGDPGNGALLWLNTELGHRRYKGIDPASGYTREDRYAGIGASYSDPKMALFSAIPVFACHMRWTDSNISTFDGKATYCSILIEKRF